MTLSCMVVHLRGEMLQLAEQVLPNLVSLLPNSAKVMASSASVCIKIMIKVWVRLCYMYKVHAYISCNWNQNIAQFSFACFSAMATIDTSVVIAIIAIRVHSLFQFI